MCDNKLVLVVDDDPDIINSVRSVLELNGLRVVSAMDGKDAVEVFSSAQPDLVLCDMMMDEIDTGLQVAKAICSIDCRVPIYLMSSIGEGMAEQADLKDCGFMGVIQKPICYESLVAAVKGALGLE